MPPPPSAPDAEADYHRIPPLPTRFSPHHRFHPGRSNSARNDRHSDPPPPSSPPSCSNSARNGRRSDPPSPPWALAAAASALAPLQLDAELRRGTASAEVLIPSLTAPSQRTRDTTVRNFLQTLNVVSKRYGSIHELEAESAVAASEAPTPSGRFPSPTRTRG